VTWSTVNNGLIAHIDLVTEKVYCICLSALSALDNTSYLSSRADRPVVLPVFALKQKDPLHLLCVTCYYLISCFYSTIIYLAELGRTSLITTGLYHQTHGHDRYPISYR